MIDPSREAAAERGEKTYTPSGPCKRGHHTPRYTSNGGCIECATRFHLRVKGRTAPKGHTQLRNFILVIPRTGFEEAHHNVVLPELQKRLDEIVTAWGLKNG